MVMNPQRNKWQQHEEEANVDTITTSTKKYTSSITLPTNDSSRGAKRQNSCSIGKRIILTGHKKRPLLTTGHKTTQSPERKRQRQEDYNPNTDKPVTFVLSNTKLLGKKIFEFVGDKEWLFVAVICVKWCSVYRESFYVTQTGLLNTLHSQSRLKYACEELGLDPSYGVIKNEHSVPWNLEYWAGYQADLKVIRHMKNICDSDGNDACRGAAQAGRKKTHKSITQGQ